MAEACEEYKALLMGYMDKELTPEEASDVNNHLIRCAGCREEYDELLEVSSRLGSVKFALPADIALKKLWRSPYSRITRLFSLLIILVGVLVVSGYSVYELFVARDLAAVPKIGILSIIVGSIILFLQVARDRIATYKTDPYKEVER